MRGAGWLVAAVMLCGCGDPPAVFDGGVDQDAGVADAGQTDAGVEHDAGEVDAGPPDAGPPDAGQMDPCLPATCLSPAGETCWSCWSGKPSAGGDVTIAAGERILLDESIDVGALRIRGTLGTAALPLTVRATEIQLEGGRWSAGTSTAPHTHPLRVSLLGPSKVVRVSANGALELHAAPPSPIFTMLAGAEDAGTSTIIVAQAPAWSTGDELLVTPSGHLALTPVGGFVFPDGGRGPTDYATLVAASGASLTLSSPLTSPRHGVLDAGAPIDLRSEVANLTRTIVLEGVDDAEWDAGVGVRVLAEGAAAQLVLEGVRIDRGGVRGALRSAAIQLNGLAADAGVVRASVVTRSPRAAELVLTSGAVLADNVFAKLEGHGVWLTTGLERDNVLEGNLVTDLRAPLAPTSHNVTEVRTLEPSAVRPGFCGVSAFVISNPDNVLRRNVASDFEGCAYWLSFASTPRDLAAGMDFAPRRVAFGTFEDNRSHSTGAGVMLAYAITPGAMNEDEARASVYEPQADERASATRDPDSTLGATLTRATILGAQLSAFRVEGRARLVAPVAWSTYGSMLIVRRGLTQIEDGLFVGKLGPAAQPIDAPPLIFASAADSLSVTRTRVAHFPTSSTRRWGGVLFTYDFPLFGFDLTVERWTQMDFTEVELGHRPPTPPDQYDVDGPILDASGIGGFPGRWWVDDAPYFTQGNTCSPARRGAGSDGMLCASAGYFGLGDIEAGTGVGTTTPLEPDAQLVRLVAGSPSVGFHSPLASFRSRALPVPAGETVELRLPGYPVPPRRLKLHTWGRAGQRAVLRIAYPAGTSFVITAQNEYYGPLAPGPVTFTQAASLAELDADPTGTRYFVSGGFLYVPLRSVFRTRVDPYNLDPILVTATGTGLP